MDNPPPYTPYPSAPPNYELGPGNASYLPYPLNPGIVSNPSYPPNPGIPPNPSYPPPPNYTPDPPCQLNPVYPPASATQPGAAYPPNPNYTASPPYPQNPILVPNPANQFSAGPSSAPLPAVNININQNQNQANTGPKRTTGYLWDAVSFLSVCLAVMMQLTSALTVVLFLAATGPCESMTCQNKKWNVTSEKINNVKKSAM
ncbi:extensin-like isoform X2 [Protopterus annectens]|uniref:extensin-like isoform X2 n=1 Tax=Protopterus annectens TaxID=7888 RepID=UPI001CFA8A6E|nr:extensin-like isoform X2 [Protopterus annectens]